MSERWVLQVYRVPWEPSTPRIAVWCKLRRLGVAQLADGLVALPLDARNPERLEWIAEEVVEVGGHAGVWLAQPESCRQEQALVTGLRVARAVEYAGVVAEAEEAAAIDDEVARDARSSGCAAGCATSAAATTFPPTTGSKLARRSKASPPHHIRPGRVRLADPPLHRRRRRVRVRSLKPRRRAGRRHRVRHARRRAGPS